MSFPLRDFSFPFDSLQFMKNRTHVFLINFFKIMEMLTFLKSHFMWRRLLLDSFKTSFVREVEFGEEKGPLATADLLTQQEVVPSRSLAQWAGVLERPHLVYIPPGSPHPSG